MPARLRNLIGMRFGSLVAVEYLGKSRWKLLCDCGNYKEVAAGDLLRGEGRTCPKCKAPPYSHLPEYSVWTGMKNRCNNPYSDKWDDYGGRGIKVLYNSFTEFIKDVGPRPEPDPIEGPYSIDRIDNDGNYEPGNCRWATWSDQQINKRHR